MYALLTTNIASAQSSAEAINLFCLDYHYPFPLGHVDIETLSHHPRLLARPQPPIQPTVIQTRTQTQRRSQKRHARIDTMAQAIKGLALRAVDPHADDLSRAQESDIERDRPASCRCVTHIVTHLYVQRRDPTEGTCHCEDKHCVAG